MGGRGAAIGFKEALALSDERKSLNRKLNIASRKVESLQGDYHLIQNKTMYPLISAKERHDKLEAKVKEIRKYQDRADDLEDKIERIDRKLSRYRR